MKAASHKRIPMDAPAFDADDTAERIAPRAHQVEALEGLRDALARGNRAQAHMCCGSGKTYTQAFLARHVIESAEDPGMVVVVCFVPNRALIHQNARNFRKIFGEEVTYLGVCSDADMAGLVAKDDIDTGLETTTDPERIAQFVARTSQPRILVSTYQSAPTLRAAIGVARGIDTPIALGLFDEAHRTAGNKTSDSLFSFALDDDRFPMDQRAFFTATPRIVEGKASESLSMSNPDLYGPVAYTYPFSRGIEDGNVVDYDLWVPIITRKDLLAYMQSQGLGGEERPAVAMIALEKVMAKTGQSRFLTYHQRIAGSQAFAAQLTAALGPSGTMVAHVDGSTPGPERERLMAALGQGQTILTNCKAFVEGVDAPGLQGVMFVDPRKSVVDVVQAVGRLSRPDPQDPGKRGSIIAPIVTESINPAALARAAKAAGFETLIQVAEALRANDDALEEDILERSRAMGRGDATITPMRNMEVLVSDGEEVDLAELAEAITVATMDALRDTFAENVGKLERHLVEHGHLPTRTSDPRLYGWMAGVRKKHTERRLEPVHAALLDGVKGWSWVGERTLPTTVAEHIAAFRDRAQRMPSGKRGGDAEADLHAHLMEAQEEFLLRGPGRGGKLTLALEEANLLFFAEEVLGKRAQQSGFFVLRPNPSGGPDTVLFYPRTDKHRTTVPIFRSGHTAPPRPILVHAGRAERERIQALSEQHSVRITLVRAGIERDPFRDGRVLDWHAGTVVRGETPTTSKASLTWLLARLMDRKVSGLPPYTAAGLQAGKLRPNKPATTLNPDAPAGTVAEVLALIERARTAHHEGRLGDARAKSLDEAPGFSWLESHRTEDIERVGTTLSGITRRWGETILASREARLKDCGLANTLHAIDGLVERMANNTTVADTLKRTTNPAYLDQILAFGNSQTPKAPLAKDVQP